MKTNLFIFYLFACLCFSMMSCQKEYSLEVKQDSRGSLKSSQAGDCLPGGIYGSYTVDVDLNDSNYLVVQVNVTQPGFYSISTNTVNGYQFTGSGIFANTGIKTITLAGKGKPVIPGNDAFEITYDTSVCNLGIIVSPPANNIPGVYTLQGAPNTCMTDTVFGYFIKNTSLTNSNYVKIGVDVASVGAYSISTNTINGYSFAGSGLFTTTGTQSVILTATGTPLNEGVDQFTVNAASSVCTFLDTVLNAVNVTNNDHFPLTFGSYWNYDNLLSPGDTLRRNIIDSSNIAGNEYKILEETPMVAAPVQYFFRKDADNYYEYGPLDTYTTSVQFNPQIFGDIPFLKENLATGDAWKSGEYIGTITGGQAVYLQYNFSCIDANAVVTINGQTYTNVYEIQLRPAVRSGTTYPYNGTGEIYTLYYAKGVGLIYMKVTSLGSSLKEFQIRGWHVN